MNGEQHHGAPFLQRAGDVAAITGMAQRGERPGIAVAWKRANAWFTQVTRKFNACKQSDVAEVRRKINCESVDSLALGGDRGTGLVDRNVRHQEKSFAMNRRDWILSSFALLLAPLRASSQQPGKIWRIGYLQQNARPSNFDSTALGAFTRGLRELGYFEGKNLVMEWRFADNRIDRLPALAEELVRLKVDLILTPSAEATRAAQNATTTIPIVMGSVGDPVGFGFVKSLARPGGNITGLSTLSIDLGPKRLEMLLSMVPKVARVALLLNPESTTHLQVLEGIQVAAKSRRVTILPVHVRSPQEIQTGFLKMVREKAGALMVQTNPLFNIQMSQIAELSLKHRLPSIAGDRRFPEAGCLMSYGTSLLEDLHRAATYVDKIFKGAKPADLPVEQPTKLALTINRKTAKALGLTIPQDLLISAETMID